MAESNIAQDELKALVRRIESLEDEIAALNADKSEVYKEAKSGGFDVKQLRKVVQKRRLPADEREEQDTVFDLYWDAVHAPEKRSAHARVENIEEFPAKPSVATLRADPALAIVEAANLQPKSENQLPQPAGGDLAVTPSPSHDDQVATHQPETATVDEGARHSAPASGERPELQASSIEAHPMGGENVVDQETAQDTKQKTETLSDAGKSAEASASVAPAPRYAAPGVVVWEHTPPEPVKRHPYSAAFGDMGQDLAVIDDDIAGAKSEPIVRVGNEILDGWARYCTARGMIGGSGLSTEYPVKQYDGDNALVDCIRWNVTGRIMTDKQLQLAAKRLIEIEPKRKAEILATFEALSA